MKLLTIGETAQLLSVNRNTLANWRYLRRGPSFVRVGKHVRYCSDAIDRWIASNTVVVAGGESTDPNAAS